MSESYRQAYREEALDLLVELEESLLELEESPGDMELVGRIFRALHTIKGSGAMFGFDDIAAYTHDIESVYDQVRDGKVTVTKDLIDMTLKAKDTIRLMLDGSQPQELSKVIVEEYLRTSQDDKPSLSDDMPGVSPDGEIKGEVLLMGAGPSDEKKQEDRTMKTYRIRFEPDPDIFLTGTNPLLLFDELGLLGDCIVVAQLDRVPVLDDMDPERCCTYWDMLLTTDQGVDAIKDVFLFVEDRCKLTIDLIDVPVAAKDKEGYKRLGEILIEKGDLAQKDLETALSQRKLIGEILVEKGLVSTGKIQSALAEQEHVKSSREKVQGKEETASSIRVAATKLDTLVNLVGELVTVQARLAQTASVMRNSELSFIAEEVERLTSELRDNTLNIRMVPIGSTFSRFKRLVRDLSGELNKEIELITDGAETELDKTVIERLSDPLVHLIRNSVDHGIEPPDMREALGKPRTGSIRLSAAHSGAQVVIKIEDDGKGLSKDAIHAKAVEKGLISSKADLSDKEIFNCIFHPGFSTAEKVTNLSGRGVGMDVVRRAIDTLRGMIEVTSEKGMGTTVTIRLPLTLAIVDGLLVNVANNRFVLPLSIVEECVELTGKDRADAHGKQLANIRGELVPYIRLRNEFGITGEPPRIEQIVVTGSNGDRVGFVVDKVIGEYQTVIKNLGRVYRDVEGISGATILGDGTVALIIDVPRVITIAVDEELRRTASIGSSPA